MYEAKNRLGLVESALFTIDERQQENMEYEFVIRHSSYTITERQQENMEYEFVIRH